ncbi:MAG: 1-aminocyclopropane-1-carboxylate deaminase/D-cysteine desulfhydrase [Flavobacteriales bacterium]|nr:1-aminocyclopropane-1-carboxylate deaminase/D-cysteine desulfhydrase [Flavobacteriales bacterium]
MMNEDSDIIHLQHAINQRVEHPLLNSREIILDIKRCDLLHPEVNGNKWYKLKYNIEQAKSEGHDTILTFGGPYSNHIHATAAAGKIFGLKTIGIIRGEEPPQWSETLRDAKVCGMQLEFITRMAYAEKATEDFKGWLHEVYGSFHLVPEGGSNFHGINGCMEILTDDDKKFYDVVCCACGTGATMSGITMSLTGDQRIVGFPVFKDGEFMREEVRRHLEYFLMDKNAADEMMQACDFITRFHFGGYAKWNDELITFMQQFRVLHKIPLDQVYTGKLMYGVMKLIEESYWKPQTKVLVIHSGGLQGRIPELLRNDLA